ESHPGNYFIHGSFSHFEDTAQPCITVVNDAGIIQEHFFQGMGATINEFVEGDIPRMPRIDVVEELDNGDLLIGGGFTEFMGEEIYSLVKLNPGFLSTDQETVGQYFTLYPNPAQHQINIQLNDNGVSPNPIVQIRDASGRLVLSQTLNDQQVDVSMLKPGFYLVQVMDAGKPLGTAKLVVE
ncbi:MAG: T9SS type A sorting domain-containing protein, partial [Flavobacteriales bacterium]|nr:T9SS type A sorting domain-containing protein [Flavobacteriales bacterium]